MDSQAWAAVKEIKQEIRMLCEQLEETNRLLALILSVVKGDKQE